VELMGLLEAKLRMRSGHTAKLAHCKDGPLPARLLMESIRPGGEVNTALVLCGRLKLNKAEHPKLGHPGSSASPGFASQ
jgi:hypothetical protein